MAHTESTSLLFDIFTAFLLGIVVLLIVIGNIFVLVILQRINTLTFNNVTKLFMRSLTISDLMVGVFIVLPNMARWANGGSFPFGDYFMFIYIKVHIFIFISGLLSLMVITIERYVAVAFSLRYATLVTQKRARIVVVCIWIISALFAAPAQESTVGDDILRKSNNMSNASELIEDVDDVIDKTANKISLWANMSVWSVLVAVPVLITLFFSIKLYMIARRHAAQIEAQHRLFHLSKKDYRGAVTFCVISAIYTFAWVPNLALSLYASYHPETGHGTHTWPPLFFFVRLILFSNSWWNVLIYYIRNSTFRTELKRILCGQRYFKPDAESQSVACTLPESNTSRDVRSNIPESNFSRDIQSTIHESISSRDIRSLEEGELNTNFTMELDTGT